MTKYQWFKQALYESAHYLRADVIFNKCFFNLKILACRQHGRVERCGLNPYYRNFEITSNCWRMIDQKKMLKSTKKDTLNPKTKKLQWDGTRGTEAIKSNPIPTGWANPQSVKKIILLKFSNRSESPESLIRLPSLQVWQWEETPRNFVLKANLQWFNSTAENRNSIFKGSTQGLMHTRTEEKKQWPHKRLDQTSLLILEGLRGTGGLGGGSYGSDFQQHEAPILWPPDAKSWLIGKDSDAGKYWR